ncbi:TonB system biopolymer transport component Chromosome segregation ATPase [gamma proteobacterium IMCC2047]|nr:TonB system biopolymer transport component Chromosome segregation ATPase [gamma proteobacterium IMCC2047]
MKNSIRQVALIGLLVFPIMQLAASQTTESTLNTLHSENQQRTQAAQKSQQRINLLDEQRQQLLDEYRSVNKLIEGLRVYNRQLEKQTDAQQTQLLELKNSIAAATQMKRQITPLMLDMQAALEEFIVLDMPFHAEERQQRLDFIDAALNNPDVSDAEKFRQLLEAYQIENEYGRKLDVYTDTIRFNDQPINVNVLRVGRISLLAQTKNQQQSWRWDKVTAQWQALDGAHNKPIRQAIRVAQQQAAPSLLMIPVSAPESVTVSAAEIEPEAMTGGTAQ